MSFETLKQQLYDRLAKNLADYHAHVLGFEKEQIIEMADRISTIGDAYSYLTAHYSFDNEDDIRYLLQFQNPLEIIADRWENRRQDMSDMSFVMWGIFDRRDAEKDYPLRADLPSQPLQPEKPGKTSLLEDLHDKEKAVKARSAPDTKPLKKKDGVIE